MKSHTNHDTLWNVRLRNDDSTHFLQDLHDHRVFLGRGKGPAHVSQGRVNALDVELVFQRDWNSMQGPFKLSSLCKIGI